MELFSEANPGNGDRSRTEKEKQDREEIMQEVSVIIQF